LVEIGTPIIPFVLKARFPGINCGTISVLFPGGIEPISSLKPTKNGVKFLPLTSIKIGTIFPNSFVWKSGKIIAGNCSGLPESTIAVELLKNCIKTQKNRCSFFLHPHGYSFFENAIAVSKIQTSGELLAGFSFLSLLPDRQERIPFVVKSILPPSM
jgi:hypothetical protein